MGEPRVPRGTPSSPSAAVVVPVCQWSDGVPCVGLVSVAVLRAPTKEIPPDRLATLRAFCRVERR